MLLLLKASVTRVSFESKVSSSSSSDELKCTVDLRLLAGVLDLEDDTGRCKETFFLSDGSVDKILGSLLGKVLGVSPSGCNIWFGMPSLSTTFVEPVPLGIGSGTLLLAISSSNLSIEPSL